MYYLVSCWQPLPLPSSLPLRHVNEDKRKTERQMQMFEVLRDVEDCPVSCVVTCHQFLIHMYYVHKQDSG